MEIAPAERQVKVSPLLQADEEDLPRSSRSSLGSIWVGASQEAEDTIEILEFLHKVEAFHDLPDEELPALAQAFTERKIADGEAIIKQGAAGSEMYFIASGKVSVRVRKSCSPGSRPSSGDPSFNSTEEEEIAILSHGHYFGEAALLTHAPRNAAVYASGNVTLRVLSRQQFQDFGLERRLRLQVREVNATGFARLRNTASLRTFAKFVIVLAVYYGLAVVLFGRAEEWSIVDCVYFASITLMTIGYGDLSPSHPASRLILVAFVLISLVVVATAVGEFLETLVALEIKNEKERKSLQLKQKKKSVGIFDNRGQRFHWRRKFCACLLALAALLGFCSLLSMMVLEDITQWQDALYFSVVTLSTIGYGDVEPRTTRAKLVIAAIALLGVPLFGMILGRIVEIAYGKARHDHVKTVVGGLTDDKFNELVHFTDDLWRAGGYNSKPQESRREEITPFEFLCFVLAKNETVTIDEIKVIMDNFSELDTDSSGLLEVLDVDEWLRRGSTNHEGYVSPTSKASRRTFRRTTTRSRLPDSESGVQTQAKPAASSAEAGMARSNASSSSLDPGIVS